jgi:hypothetical protein
MSDPGHGPVNRRTVLTGLASGVAASLAGCAALDSDADGPVSQPSGEAAAALAERFAPTVYFDEHEQWFPTDPRRFEREQDGKTVVDGFDALNGYVAAADETPPDPMAFYNVLEYQESSLAVVQYWFYSVFDQFTTNFHWHDWELLQVFVDTETDTPQLYVASSHSRKVPNNEFLDPAGDHRPRILSELGSHSSGLSLNDDAEHFQRFALEERLADITNSAIDSVESLARIPLAYGLPRDEGLSLPYAVPELDGAPIYEHERLPAVSEADLLPADLTVQSFDALQSPPDLPTRESGIQFEYAGATVGDADVSYELHPSTAVEHIDEFVGPQLSFEFAVPDFAEDAIASHITTAGVPWQDARYTDPAADISDPKHRQALADRYEAIGLPSSFNQVVANVTNAVTAADAPEDEGLTTTDAASEMFALLQSEATAVPTFNGVAVVQDVPPGEHRLTVNGAGIEPHSESVTVGADETAAAGVDGEIPVVARENAVKLEVDPSEADSELTDLAVEDDFAGRMYDAPLAGPDAVYVHRGGAYTTEVRDSDDEVGAVRVNPSDDETVRITDPATGKASLASYLAAVSSETATAVAAVEDAGGSTGRSNAVQGLANALDAVAEAAERASENAEAGNRDTADKNLERVATRLGRVALRLSEARDDLPDPIALATEKRLAQSHRRARQAIDASSL